MRSRHSCHSLWLIHSTQFHECLLRNYYPSGIQQRATQTLCSSSILPSALKDLLIFLKKQFEFLKIYLIIICPSKEAQKKYPFEMKNREEMRKNEPGNCASWNVGVICPEMPIYQEAYRTWHPKGRRTWAWVQLLLCTCGL